MSCGSPALDAGFNPVAVQPHISGEVDKYIYTT